MTATTVRDRVWISALTKLYRTGEVKVSDIDASISVASPDEEVLREFDQEPQDIVKGEDGKHKAVFEEDASAQTKRSVLRAMEEAGLVYREKEQGQIYKKGPVLKIFFDYNSDIDMDETLQLAQELEPEEAEAVQDLFSGNSLL